MTKDGYDVYIMYLALQRHFSTTYDYFQYNEKLRLLQIRILTEATSLASKKLLRSLKKKDREDFFIAHFLDNPKEWIRNMSKAKLDEYRARYKNFPTKFEEDLHFIKLNGPYSMLQHTKDAIPGIHKYCINNTLSIETICILDQIFPYLDKHRDNVQVPFVWPDYISKVYNYKPFVQKKLKNDFINILDIARNVLF